MQEDKPAPDWQRGLPRGTPALHFLPGILWTASDHHEPTSRHTLSPDSSVASRVSVSICGVLLPSSGKEWNLWYSAGSRIHNFTWENRLHTQSHPQPEVGGSLLTCDLDPGVIGTLRLFKSQMKISESPAPEARRFPCIRINIKDISKDSPPISEREKEETHIWGTQSLPHCSSLEATRECFHSDKPHHALTRSTKTQYLERIKVQGPDRPCVFLSLGN